MGEEVCEPLRPAQQSPLVPLTVHAVAYCEAPRYERREVTLHERRNRLERGLGRRYGIARSRKAAPGACFDELTAAAVQEITPLAVVAGGALIDNRRALRPFQVVARRAGGVDAGAALMHVPHGTLIEHTGGTLERVADGTVNFVYSQLRVARTLRSGAGAVSFRVDVAGVVRGLIRSDGRTARGAYVRDIVDIEELRACGGPMNSSALAADYMGFYRT